MTTTAPTAADSALPDETRRALLCALPVAALSAALPAAAEGSTEVARAFAACCALCDQFNALPLSTSQEEQDAVFLSLRTLEDELFALPSRTVADLAMKVWVWTAYGTDYGFDFRLDEPLVAEVARLAGVEDELAVNRDRSAEFEVRMAQIEAEREKAA